MVTGDSRASRHRILCGYHYARTDTRSTHSNWLEAVRPFGCVRRLGNQHQELLRRPSGTAAKCFFAKHPWHGLDASVRRVDTGDKEPTIAVDDLTGLLSLVQASVVEIYPWGSTIDHLEKPERLIFDLDPGENVRWEVVIEAAHDVHDRLAALSLQSFVKTSGGKGLHIVAPIQPEAGWEEVKTFTKTVADTMAKERPDRYVATVAKRARRARIFVDYLRNDRGATAIAAYSTRTLPRASVSTPLSWNELSPGLRSDHFTVGNLLHRLSRLKRDPWQGFFKIRQRLPRFQPGS
jgi:bifunctional non-homologous end joining protein LigD